MSIPSQCKDGIQAYTQFMQGVACSTSLCYVHLKECMMIIANVVAKLHLMLRYVPQHCKSEVVNAIEICHEWILCCFHPDLHRVGHVQLRKVDRKLTQQCPTVIIPQSVPGVCMADSIDVGLLMLWPLVLRLSVQERFDWHHPLSVYPSFTLCNCTWPDLSGLRSPRPSPSLITYCKWSNAGDGNGLGDVFLGLML